MTADFSERLIAHALGVEWPALQDGARSAALAFLQDTLAVGIAGRNEARADLVLAQARRWCGSGGTSLVLARPGERLSAPYAAFVNGYQIHNQEFDCVHEAAVAHPMATVCSALLAESGTGPGVSGQRFLEGLVAGVEVVAALGMAGTQGLTFFRPATCGIFGCVAAIARMRGLSPDVTRCAFGHALGYASGTMQAHVEGKPTLALQVANAARSAVVAVDLARAGFPAPVDALEGPFGYFALFETEVDLAPVLERLGHGTRIEEVSWKPFPTGRAAHGGIVAIQQLMRDHGVTGENLHSLTYRAPPIINRLVGRRPTADMSISYARLCLAWLGAVVLKNGTVRLDDFSAENLASAGLLGLAERISVEVDGSDNWSVFAPGLAKARLTDGRQVAVTIERQFGAPEWPLDRGQQMAKTCDCLSFAGMNELAGPLADLIEGFAGLQDVHQSLCDLFEQGGPANGSRP
jgi:2-methylcitrate dehydratase PrpD